MNVIVKENRQVSLSGIGQIIGEHNATVLNFTFPKEIIGIDIDELNKYIIFDLDGVSPQIIENDTFNLSSLYTEQTELIMQIAIMRGKDLLFKSEKFMLEFEDGIEVNYETTVDDLDVINNLITQYQKIVEQVIEINKNLKNFETTIEDAERLRVLAEDARIIGEDIRVSNEESRIANENIRVSNEKERIKSETNRSNDEKIRQSNETERTTNESTRIENEQARKDNFKKLSKELEDAIKGIDNTIDTKVVQRFNNIKFSINNNGDLEVKLING